MDEEVRRNHSSANYQSSDEKHMIPEKSDLSRLTPLVMVLTIPLWRVLAPPAVSRSAEIKLKKRRRMVQPDIGATAYAATPSSTPTASPSEDERRLQDVN